MSAQYVVPDGWHKAVFDAFWQRLETAMDNAPSGELTIPSKDDVTLILAAVLPLAVAQERERIADELEALAKTLETLATLKEYSREQRRAYANQADTFRMKAAAIRQEPGHV